MYRWIAVALIGFVAGLAGCEDKQEDTPLNPAGTRQQEEPIQAEGEVDTGKTADARPQQQTHTATGEVESLDPKAGQITITHGAVESLGWPEMTMPFSVQDPQLLQGIKAGAKIEFTFREGPAGQYTIQEIRQL